MSLKYDKYKPLKFNNRIFLGYSLDLLLNRKCLLKEYEDGVMDKITEYNTRRYEEIAKKNGKKN